MLLQILELLVLRASAQILLHLVLKLDECFLAADLLPCFAKLGFRDLFFIIFILHQLVLIALHLKQLVLFFLKSCELCFDVGVVEVHDVFAQVELWPPIELPSIILKLIVLFNWDVEVSSSAKLVLKFSNGRALLFNTGNHSVWDKRRPVNVVSLLGLANV